MLPPTVERAVDRYLTKIDRRMPGRIIGFYVVGSTALGAYREGRSDIDFVAVVDPDPGPGTLRHLRAQHVWSAARTGTDALRRGCSPLTGTCNGYFINADQLATPVTEIVPVASHSGHEFQVGQRGSDISPVGWKVLAERGITIRGAEPSALPLDPQLHLMGSWNLGNLDRYWRPWADSVARAPGPFRLRPRWATAWGVLGAPRLHHSIATGDVISKEAAGTYALDVFPSRWHRLIGDALAYWRREPSTLDLTSAERRHSTAEFVRMVITDAAEASTTRNG